MSLLPSLLLSEDYVVYVLGFERSLIKESKYSLSLYHEILEEHMLFENMFGKSMDWVKSNVENGAGWLKDKGNEAVDAIKEFGANTEGVVMAIISMMKDPAAISKYMKNINNELYTFTAAIKSPINKIAMFFHEREMPKIGNMIEQLGNKLGKLVDNFVGKGWKGVLSGMAIGLLFMKLNEEFGITEKLEAVGDVIEDPKSAAKEFFTDYWNAESEEGEDKSYAEQVQDFFSGKIESGIEELIQNSDFLSAIKDWVMEKLGIIETIKEKLTGFVKGAASKALETFAGPISWIKDMITVFKNSKWVIDRLSNYLQEYKFPEMLKRR